jgi:hypothetical protein
MILKSGFSKMLALVLIITLGVINLYSQKVKTNYYLGILADGYPASLITNEFRSAKASLINMRDNLILFGITKKTKVTTFFKKLPFLKEVYVNEKVIKKNKSLARHPLVMEFLSLLKKQRKEQLLPAGEITSASAQHILKKGDNIDQKVDKSLEQTKVMQKNQPGQQGKISSGNMELLDTLLRKKARARSSDTKSKKE